MTTPRPIPGEKFELRDAYRALTVSGGRRSITIGPLDASRCCSKSLTDDEREALAWALLPDDVREKLTRWYGNGGTDPALPITAWVHRMTDPPWEPSDEDIETTAKALVFGITNLVAACDRRRARHILIAQHDAGLLREDDQ